jgi:endonuclease YncB( thermonuclease family)
VVKTARALVAVLLVVGLAVLLYLGGEAGWWSAPAPGGTTQGSPSSEQGAAASDDPAVPSDAGEAWIDYVHDGDTLFLTDGRKVRLLGIDTPEVGEHAECYGDIARDQLRALLPEGTRVRTVADVRPLDQYGRSLLFLFTDDGALVNLDLIRDGYAEAVVLEPNVLWADELEAAEHAAQAASLGLWSAC